MSNIKVSTGYARIAALALSLVMVIMTFAPVSAQTAQAAEGLYGVTNYGTSFTHVVTAANTGCGFNQCSYIDHPLTNNNPNAVLFVTQTRMVNGAATADFNAHPVGVWYAGAQGKWAIFNEDLAAMTAGAAFSVHVESANANVYKHVATAGNSAGDYTVLNHALANGNINAVILVTQDFGSGVYNAHHIGLVYNAASGGRWRIFNQDGTAIPVGATFNVFVISIQSVSAYTHAALANTIPDALPNTTVLNNAILNSNPDAAFQITPVRIATTEIAGPVNNNAVRTTYASGSWRIINPSGVAMPQVSGFNVVITDTDASTDRVVNGSFEVQGVNAKTPAGWSVVKGSGVVGASPKARRACDTKPATAYNGRCAFILKGGATNVLSQSVSTAGLNAGDTVILNAYVQGHMLTAGKGAIQVVVKYSGGGQQKFKVPNAIVNAGTYGYTKMSAQGVLSGTPSKVVVKIRRSGLLGFLRVDAVSMTIVKDVKKALPLPAAPLD